MLEVKTFYDRYWLERDAPRAEARSRERAAIAAGLLRRAGAGKQLLDLGCGPGWALDELRAAGFEAAGADASAVAVEAAAGRGFRAERLDLEKGPFGAACGLPLAAYDAVLLLEVLEHLVDPLGVLAWLRGALRPGALLVVSLPNEVHLLARGSLLAGRLPFGGHADPHLRHFDRRRARELFAAAGFAVLAERPVSVAPPRLALARRLLAPATRLIPGAFAIASVYLLGGAGRER